jgi:hypothetical protein
LATIAEPTYFSDTYINGGKFVDGALGANDPVLNVEEEAVDIWYETTGELELLIKAFISISTSHPGIRSVSEEGLKQLIDTLRKEATETESTNQRFESRWREFMATKCFQFNVTNGLKDVKLAEFDQQDLLRAATVAYLTECATMGVVVACVENLHKKECT